MTEEKNICPKCGKTCYPIHSYDGIGCQRCEPKGMEATAEVVYSRWGFLSFNKGFIDFLNKKGGFKNTRLVRNGNFPRHHPRVIEALREYGVEKASSGFGSPDITIEKVNEPAYLVLPTGDGETLLRLSDMTVH